MGSTAVAHDLILGRYRPVRPLGAGGMGSVWLARDERSGLDVALKVVERTGRVAERAEREARAAAALRHPRCQRIYALARDHSHVYIAYEYVPGRTMRQALDAGELADRDWLEVAAQVLDALAHAHARGIVHRDVKPSNVLLAENEATDVRLLDFGLAQMAEFDTLTAIGDVPGTLTYVSPERLAGEPATAAADVWAVGVMLWEALARHHPFRSADAQGTTRRIRAGAPPIESVRPDLPPGVQAALAGALAPDPAGRPSATALAAALRVRPPVRRPPPPRRVAAPGAERATDLGRTLAKAADRALPAAAAAIWTGWATTTLPFYPAGWPLGLTVVAGALGFARPRLAFPFALAATVLPVANVSVGLAAVFAAFAVVWSVLTWSDPRGNVVAVAGPLLGFAWALALLPLVAQLARRPLRRALQVLGAVLVAAIVAELTRRRLPLTGASPPVRLGVAGNKDPVAAGSALVRALRAHLALVEVAVALAAFAVAFPYLRGRGIAAAALAGVALLVATTLLAPAAPFAAVVLPAVVVAAVLALAPGARAS